MLSSTAQPFTPIGGRAGAVATELAPAVHDVGRIQSDTRRTVIAQARPIIYEPRAVPNEFGPADVAERAWLSAAALVPGASVVVSSADGGVGRSTLVSALGGLLALAVPGPVTAVDMMPVPWGGLGARVGRQNAGTVWDTVRDLHTLTSRREVERWVQRGPTGLYAWVIKPDNTAEQRPLEATPVGTDTVIVTKGLNAGEKVVVNGQYRLQAGSRVDAKVETKPENVATLPGDAS